MAKAAPQRFIVHVRYFGGFDAAPLRPAAVVENRETGVFIAVYPAKLRAWRRLCEEIGVQLVQG